MKTPWPRYTTRIMRKQMALYFRRFWVKEPHHSKTISDEKCYLYRSMHPHTMHWPAITASSQRSSCNHTTKRSKHYLENHTFRTASTFVGIHILGISVGYLFCDPERWIVDRGPIYTERLFRAAMKKTDKTWFLVVCDFQKRSRCVYFLIFMVWPVLLCSRTRYASISIALPWLIAVFGFTPSYSLWPHKLYLSRMKNQHGLWVYDVAG